MAQQDPYAPPDPEELLRQQLLAQMNGGAPTNPEAPPDPYQPPPMAPNVPAPVLPTDPAPPVTPQPTPDGLPVVPDPNPAWNTGGFAAPAYTAQGSASAIGGWAGDKWADPNHQTPKYAVGRILSQFTPSIENLGRAVLEIQKAYPGATFNGKDKVTIPGVGTIDLLTNSGSGQNMQWWWGDESTQAGGAAGGVGGAGGGTGGTGTGAGGAGGGGAYGDQVRAKILSLMGQGPASMSDPFIKAESDAYAQAQQRGLENTRAAMAERAGTSGTLGAGGYTADVQSAVEGVGQNIAGKNADLVGRANEQRRAEIMQALSLGTTYLSEQERNALQSELYKLNLGWDMTKYQYEASQSPFTGIFG